MLKNRVVITFSQEELRTLNQIVQDADGERAMEYLTTYSNPPGRHEECDRRLRPR